MVALASICQMSVCGGRPAVNFSAAHCWRAKFPEESVSPALIFHKVTQPRCSCREISETLSQCVRHMQHVARAGDNNTVWCVCLILYLSLWENTLPARVTCACGCVNLCTCLMSGSPWCFLNLPVFSPVAHSLLPVRCVDPSPCDTPEPWVGVWAATAPSPRTPPTSAATSANSAQRATSATSW